jgi:hypothetical protein
MTRVVITSLGPAEKLGAAMVPVRAQRAGEYASRGIIDGQPGTQPIPAPRPGGVPQDSHRALHRSSDAPPVWYPGVYYERPGDDGLEHAPVSVLSDNQMPMPALSPLGLPSVSMRRPRIGGQYQQPQVARVAFYPPLGGRPG